MAEVEQMVSPTYVLCWKRPEVEGAINLMLPACDRALGHRGKHSWELAAQLKAFVKEIRKDATATDGASAEASKVASVRRSIADDLEHLIDG